MTQEQQLQSVKEFGMNFYYMNHPEIWPKFCATYEGIYDRLGEFDTWYSQQMGTGGTLPNLQAEWKEYIRVMLDTISRNALANFDIMYSTRRSVLPSPTPPFDIVFSLARSSR